MRATVKSIRVVVRVSDGTADAEELDESVRHLRHELLALNVDAVDLVEAAGVPPAGSKGADAAVIGALAVAVCHPDVLVSLIIALRDWAAGRNRTVRLEVDGDVLEVAGATSGQQQQLIDAWLRHLDGK
jgi:hypothetical protein